MTQLERIMAGALSLRREEGIERGAWSVSMGHIVTDPVALMAAIDLCEQEGPSQANYSTLRRILTWTPRIDSSAFRLQDPDDPLPIPELAEIEEAVLPRRTRFQSICHLSFFCFHVRGRGAARMVVGHGCSLPLSGGWYIHTYLGPVGIPLKQAKAGLARDMLLLKWHLICDFLRLNPLHLIACSNSAA
jgi:hypothetical protein